MAKVTMRERAVQFFEIVDSIEGNQIRVTQRDWNGILSLLGRAKVDERTWRTDQTLIGTVHSSQQDDHLLLHKVKSEGEWLSVMDMNTGEWSELEFQASRGYLDTTVIAFLPYGNVIGVMQGSTAAPGSKSLENWVNGLKLFTKPVVVRPLLSKAEVQKLATASGATKVEIRIGAHKAQALQNKSGRLARFLRTASDDYGDLRVTVTISIPRGGGREEDRQRLLADLQDLEDVMPGAADMAKAKLVYTNSNGGEYAQLAEFVEHHITAKRRVPAVDEEGNSIRILSAVQVILGVAAEHEEELRKAADLEE